MHCIKKIFHGTRITVWFLTSQRRLERLWSNTRKKGDLALNPYKATLLFDFILYCSHIHSNVLCPNSATQIQWDESGGQCGICGEPWPGKKNYERPNGIMAQHQIRTATYLENAMIRIRLQITVSHGVGSLFICNTHIIINSRGNL